MRNRCIAVTVLVTIIVAIVHCSTKDDPESAKETTEQQAALAADTLAQAIAPSDTNPFDESYTAEASAKENPNGLSALKGIEDEDFENANNTAAGNAASTTNWR